MSDKVRVAIIGVGNCASSFIQGVQFYRNAKADEFVPGLMHVNLGGYHISDIEFTCAFDIDKTKVGKDLSQAIWGGRNCTVKFCRRARPGSQGLPGHDSRRPGQVPVGGHREGPRPDGRHRRHPQRHQDRRGGELPARGQRDGHQVVRGADPGGRLRLRELHPGLHRPREVLAGALHERGLPVIGDDIKSQVGATIVHRVLTRLMRERGVRLERTSQLNVGGNTDFLNMLERSRLESKKISKTNSVTSQLDYDMGSKNIHIGPSDYVEWLDDRKWAYIRMEGRTFGDVPLNIELKLEVVDSPNSRRHRHRRRALRQAGPRPGHLRRPVRAGLVLHEVAAHPVQRRRSPAQDRGLHRRRSSLRVGRREDRAEARGRS